MWFWCWQAMRIFRIVWFSKRVWPGDGFCIHMEKPTFHNKCASIFILNGRIGRPVNSPKCKVVTQYQTFDARTLNLPIPFNLNPVSFIWNVLFSQFQLKINMNNTSQKAQKHKMRCNLSKSQSLSLVNLELWMSERANEQTKWYEINKDSHFFW